LREELGKQMVWTVYFEADDKIPFGTAVYAMDAIQGMGAKVEWITPQIREELNRQGPVMLQRDTTRQTNEPQAHESQVP
jgi:Iap family predicted aminopeptidase